MFPYDKRMAFTLVEMMITVIVLGVITAIAVPIYLNQKRSAWKAEVVSDVTTTAVEAVHVSNGIPISYTGVTNASDMTYLSRYYPSGASDTTMTGDRRITLSTGDSMIVTIKGNGSFTIRGMNDNIDGWYYQYSYDDGTGNGSWVQGSFDSTSVETVDTPSIPDKDECDNAMSTDGDTLTIGASGVVCKITIDHASSWATKYSTVHQVVIKGMVQVSSKGRMFSNSTTGMENVQTIGFDGGRISFESGFNASWFLSHMPRLNEINSSGWDVSNVSNMSHMFENDTNFNANLNDWNTGNVTDMSYMFHNVQFNGNISDWDVGRVTTMSHMFDTTKGSFGSDLYKWDTRNVTDMSYMFANSTSSNMVVGNDDAHWDTSRVTTMSHMFDGATGYNGQGLKFLDVGNVRDMSYMFRNAASFVGDGDMNYISDWNTSHVRDFSHMFDGAVKFTSMRNDNGTMRTLASWNVANATNLDGMFRNAKAFTTDISKWSLNGNASMVGFADGSGLTAGHIPSL